LGQNRVKLYSNDLNLCKQLVLLFKNSGDHEEAKVELKGCLARGKGIVERRPTNDHIPTVLVNNAYQIYAELLRMAGRGHAANAIAAKHYAGDIKKLIKREFQLKAKKFLDRHAKESKQRRLRQIKRLDMQPKKKQTDEL
jgi:hypothetical protein